MNEIFTNFKESMTKKYVDFNGRAGRKEYWLFQLFNGIIATLLYILMFISIDSYEGPNTAFTIVNALYCLAILLPNLSVTVRRLHDVGKGGGWIFITFVPVIGGLYLLYLMICKGEPNANRFGEPIQ